MPSSPKKAAPKANAMRSSAKLSQSKAASNKATAKKAAPKKPAKSVGGVYLADGTEYKGKNGKPSGTGGVAPTAAERRTARVYGTKGGPGGNNTNMVPFKLKAAPKKATPKATRAKPIPRTTRSSSNPNRPSIKKAIPRATRSSKR